MPEPLLPVAVAVPSVPPPVAPPVAVSVLVWVSVGTETGLPLPSVWKPFVTVATWLKSRRAFTWISELPCPSTLARYEAILACCEASNALVAPSLDPAEVSTPGPDNRSPLESATVTWEALRPGTELATRCTMACTSDPESVSPSLVSTSTDAPVGVALLTAKVLVSGMARLTWAPETPWMDSMVDCSSPCSAWR